MAIHEKFNCQYSLIRKNYRFVACQRKSLEQLATSIGSGAHHMFGQLMNFVDFVGFETETLSDDDSDSSLADFKSSRDFSKRSSRISSDSFADDLLAAGGSRRTFSASSDPVSTRPDLLVSFYGPRNSTPIDLEQLDDV